MRQPRFHARHGHAADGAEADLLTCKRLTGPLPCSPPAQRRSMGMLLRRGAALIDLPVDVMVILEQQD
jgi:hypothetical protein